MVSGARERQCGEGGGREGVREGEREEGGREGGLSDQLAQPKRLGVD